MKWLQRNSKQLIKPSIEEKQSEKLRQLGAQLASLRQEQGLSLDELVVLTKIPRRLLQAIETGDLKDLPEPIYIQGLIRQFADALGMKGAEFASTFPIGSPSFGLPATWKAKPIEQLRPVHLYLLYIFLIICSVKGLSQLLNNEALQANNNQLEIKSQTESGLIPQQIQSKELQEIQPVSDTFSPRADIQTVEIGVTLKSSSWIRVIADGRTEFEGVLPQGSHRNWKATQQLTVKTNNAGGVLMSVNQQQAKEMGQPGKAGEVRIAAKAKS
ncbi:helix-turn-helix domain-containing protein [Anabaena catenula]|uniref:Helix-turn-helix domain-containing protein n=1 Tax=Anabaena catenula FACHB-362 TaxID=2692877 RepID=A0ABR8JAC8_9NOST|nr:RodZ domain-containing protein [Anabaena catenula]MBD2694066.1 helix-turn-helix domain-containing protein [Anabaena catenula FACHB-362]